MDWNIFISIITQFGTLITIILVYLTLREMRNQRIASQKPDLILKDIYVYGYAYVSFYDVHSRMARLPIPRYWSLGKEVENMAEFIATRGTIGGVQLSNVGIGVAKNIELRWGIEYEKIAHQIREYCYQNSVPLDVRVRGGPDGTMIQEIQFGRPGYTVLPSETTDSHDYLMPVAISREGFETYIPQSLVELASLWVYVQMHHAIEANNNRVKLNPHFLLDGLHFKLQIQYDDLEDSHYLKEFDVNFYSRLQPHQVQEDDTLGKCLFSGSLIFKSQAKKAKVNQNK